MGIPGFLNDFFGSDSRHHFVFAKLDQFFVMTAILTGKI
jgi:hypothetical protein